MGVRRRPVTSPVHLDSQGKRIIRAAIYARYSSQMQKKDSIEDQVNHIKSYLAQGRIQSRKWPGCEIHISEEWIISDEAKSAKSAARDGYQRILDGIRTDAYDLLLVDHLNRATRDLGGTVDLFRLVDKSGKEFLSVSEGLSSADPNADTYFNFHGIVNQMDNKTKAQNTKRGMEEKYRRGFSCGDAPYGYKSNATNRNTGKGQNKECDFELKVDEDKALIIRRIYKLYAEGLGMSAICRKFNSECVPWPSYPKGRGWSQTTVNTILINEKYIGVWLWNMGRYFTDPNTGQKEWIPRPENEWVYFRDQKVNEDLIIIDKDLWDSVQAIKQDTDRKRIEASAKSLKIFGRRPHNSDTNLLSGFLKCADCKEAMIVVSGKGYYGCQGAYRKGTCTNRNMIRSTMIEDRVIDVLRDFFRSEENAERLAKAYNQQKSALTRTTKSMEQELTEEIARLRVEVANLVTFISSGHASEAVSKRLKFCEERTAEIEKQLAYASFKSSKQVFVLSSSIKQKLDYLSEILSLDRVSARKIIQNLIEGPIYIREVKDISNLLVRVNEFALLNDRAVVV